MQHTPRDDDASHLLVTDPSLRGCKKEETLEEEIINFEENVV